MKLVGKTAAEIATEARTAEITLRLGELDKIISREMEDWYREHGDAPTLGFRADAMAEKTALRQELATL